MIISKDFAGYIEGMDISKIEPNAFLAYPSKNSIIYKKTAFSRPGIKNDGNAPTGNFKIIGEYVWKDSLAGELPLRCTLDGRVQLKWYGVWITIFSSLDGSAVRVRFAEWTDINGAIVKNRLFFVDGSDRVYQWNGGVAQILSCTVGAGIITAIEAADTSASERSGGGVDYTAGDLLTITGGDGTAKVAVDSVIAGGLKQLNIHSAGTSYAVNDYISITNTHGGNVGVIKVDTVDGGGAVLTWHFISRGDGYVTDDAAIIATTTTGSGTSFTVNIYNVGNTINLWHLATQGTGYSVSDNNATTGGTGTGATISITTIIGNQIAIDGSNTVEQLGFDPISGSSVNNPNVLIARFNDGALVGIDTNSYVSESTTFLNMTSNPSPVPNKGDLVISTVVTYTDILSGVPKDDIYNFGNHLALAALTRVRVYFSDIAAYLNFTPPIAADATVASPFFVNLPGNYTAMISRYNQSTQQSTLWMSTADSWTKITQLLTQNSAGYWYDSESVSASEHLGAYPFAVADYKGDIIFLAQDNTLQQITTIDVLAKDVLQLLSNNVEGMLNRLAPKDKTTVRLYYLKRYIYIVYQNGSTMAMLDMIDGYWQPPQTIPLSYMSIIDGAQFGHSNVRDETYQLFTGRNDLGAPIQSVFAFGYYQGYQRISRTTHVTQDFFLKSYTRFGVNCRMTKFTIATVQQLFENDGAKFAPSYDIDGRKVKMFMLTPDESWGSNAWGGASVGGADEPQSDPNNPVNNITSQNDIPPSDLGKVYAWTKVLPVTFFEHRVIITVNPVGEGNFDQEFHLIGWYMDDTPSDRIISPDLFIPVKGS